MLVAMLTARTSSTVPLDLEIFFSEFNLFDLTRGCHCDGDRRRVNSSLAFSWWYSLDSVSA